MKTEELIGDLEYIRRAIASLAGANFTERDLLDIVCAHVDSLLCKARADDAAGSKMEHTTDASAPLANTGLRIVTDDVAKDAKRYHWLRNPSLPVAVYINGELPFAVDAAIDAAIAQRGK